jgi:hypothetical protein
MEGDAGQFAQGIVPAIVTYHTSTDVNLPALLYAGEFATMVGPTFTKVWLGDGAANRLLLSNDPADTPILGGGGGDFLPLTGGTLTGPLTLAADPAIPLEAATKNYVDLIPRTTISDVPPPAPIIGDGWFDTISGIMYIWYRDADSDQWVGMH